MVGASTAGVCGVREYSKVLAEALRRREIPVSLLWWERDRSWGLVRTMREFARWTEQVRGTLRAAPAAWVVWHYSAFTYCWRGIPVLAPVAVRRLAEGGRPLAVLGHELVYPWGTGGWRGRVMACTQRLALVAVLARTRAAVVTTESVRQWLMSRRWLPPRPVEFIPVPSNLPLAPAKGDAQSSGRFTIGVFGYGAPSFWPEPVVEALASLRSEGLNINLVMIGAPGADSPAAERWRTPAARAGLDRHLRFTGVLPPGEVAQDLEAVDIVVFPDWTGPMSRRGSLAAALAQGCSVVAFDGPYRWEDLVAAGAVALVEPTADRLADLLRSLLRDAEARRQLGRRAQVFYVERMHEQVVADRLVELLRGLGP